MKVVDIALTYPMVAPGGFPQAVVVGCTLTVDVVIHGDSRHGE